MPNGLAITALKKGEKEKWRKEEKEKKEKKEKWRRMEKKGEKVRKMEKEREEEMAACRATVPAGLCLPNVLLFLLCFLFSFFLF